MEKAILTRRLKDRDPATPPGRRRSSSPGGRPVPVPGLGPEFTAGLYRVHPGGEQGPAGRRGLRLVGFQGTHGAYSEIRGPGLGSRRGDHTLPGVRPGLRRGPRREPATSASCPWRTPWAASWAR
ncbi:MAG: hypothetical protein M0C28_25565 [Candidatus Moduliflexus flocculans]|nr:hypothetical protein [Candidatus Moduliflexus flocculans]